ncbi:hypothetical protein Sant_0882 [Sodalis praecaptivus]|uniref:Uncharacterized protein n=1 Tax=Sodalis praecaptivus TaxID=1239307 RepID=W0HTX8_9GAMM|nr:hypothetical protein Sant_0882 [Sodalis praecaptivus]
MTYDQRGAPSRLAKRHRPACLAKPCHSHRRPASLRRRNWILRRNKRRPSVNVLWSMGGYPPDARSAAMWQFTVSSAAGMIVSPCWRALPTGTVRIFL